MAGRVLSQRIYTPIEQSGSNGIKLSDETLSVIMDIVTQDYDSLFVQIKSTGNALDQFSISGRANDNADFSPLFVTPGDFTSPAGILIGASGDLTALTNGTLGWFILYPKSMQEIRIEAARASGANTTVELWGGGAQ